MVRYKLVLSDLKSTVLKACCDKIKVLIVSIKNTRFSKYDVLPNQVHYDIAVNKRIKLLKEIYKWHYGQINHI